MDNENKSSQLGKPTKEEIIRAISSFGNKERKIFWALLVATVMSAVVFVQSGNRLLMSEVPTYGGSFVEGIIGTPRFVNPILAITDADRDVSALIYSGLLRKTSDGGFIPDLAEKYEISPDGLTYTFTIRDGAVFHDKTPVTTEDIEFTILKAKDPVLKSPRRPNWEGVSIKKLDGKNISFTLKQPYAQFLENTVIGVLPKHIWKDVPVEEFSFSDFNLEGIGSGPYEIESINKSAGIPSEYSLKSFDKFTLGTPYINKITLKFFGNEEDLLNALKSRAVDNVTAITPEEAKELSSSSVQIRKYPLPRVYGVYFNQSENPILSDIPVRLALYKAVDRKRIVESVLFGYGTTLYGPLPSGGSPSFSSEENSNIDRVSEARSILEKAGWKYDDVSKLMFRKEKKATTTISVSIATGDRPELKKVAELVKEDWEKLGIKVNLNIYEAGDLSQNIIRPRKYEALLFGQVVGRDSDPFAFWHSSQRNDPGLNIALYANSKVDKILEDARGTLDLSARHEKYKQFENEVVKDTPVVFLYSPEFIYVLSPDLKGMEIGELTVPGERFLNIYQWYKESDLIWKIFNNK